MPERRVGLYTIPARRAFADALVAGLMRRHGGDVLALAGGLVLLPNNRGRRAIQEAFVRASGGGLVLPRLVTIGDPALDEATGTLFDPIDDADPLPPAAAPLQRRLILARLVSEERARRGEPVTADEAVRLAGAMARTLDQLLVEGVDPARLRDLDVAPELSEHWRRALDLFAPVTDRWRMERARIGVLDAPARRTKMLERLAARWRGAPPAGFVCAAGITDPGPAVAALLRCIAALPRGMVVFQDLGVDLPDDEWAALGPHDPDPAGGLARRSIETHPQFQPKLLLARMGHARGEVHAWRDGSDHDAAPARGRAIANALAPADFTGKWTSLDADQRRLAGIRAAEFATPADEAQGIALVLRGVLEQPGRTAALVTPDRALAERVAAHCARWGIAIDDTAGQPLATRASGTLLILLAEAAAQDFAPLALLALLKHPLAAGGDRAAWLDGVRALDRALRGPRPAPGLDGIEAHLAEGSVREAAIRAAARSAWPTIRALLDPLAAAFAEGDRPLVALIAALRDAAQRLCGDMLWAGPAGRAAADLIAQLETHGIVGPPTADPASIAPLLRLLMAEIAVRPPQGGHPRLAIYGLIEARLQTADLMVLGALNEGIWPTIAAPDPWLAPRIRSELGLPGLERGIGVAAHDFANALGAPDVLITRARRDGRSPTLPSRLWLRLAAMAGERFERAREVENWAVALDDPRAHQPADRPAPAPPADRRPRRISVTEVDRLKADPYAFYARRMLGLHAIEAIDAVPSAAWRGTQVHAILQRWFEDGGDPVSLAPRALALLDDVRTHPMIRALWGPRLVEAIDWIAGRIAADVAGGRRMLAVERSGVLDIAGVELSGTFDRIDRLPGGGLAIVDYKTGQPPSIAAVRAGFSLQLGLLGMLAEAGRFAGIEGRAASFEYWSLARNRQGGFGYVDSPNDLKKRDPIPADDFTAMARDNFIAAAATWLTGDAPFTAKLRPEYAPYGDYDQLMRRDEWYGRERR
ncbi:double-strand break repair protein AddB [uncultured Sphingomonas sp.]|uniref:double-strand break repair protein AddB n=1 Tax=uncultured Sphingomonas sp. TaxID=158754 RepID=UPI0035CB41ED